MNSLPLSDFIIRIRITQSTNYTKIFFKFEIVRDSFYLQHFNLGFIAIIKNI